MIPKNRGRANTVEFPSKATASVINDTASKHVDLHLRTFDITRNVSGVLSLPKQIAVFLFDLVYQLIQVFVIMLFKPVSPVTFACMATLADTDVLQASSYR
jgi:hypothetical protein